MTAYPVTVLIALAAVVLSFGLAAAGSRRLRRARARAEDVMGGRRVRRRRLEPGVWARRWAAPLGAVALGWALVGGVYGTALGVVVGAGLWWWRGGPGRAPGALPRVGRAAMGPRAPVGDRGGGDGPSGGAPEGACQVPLAADLLAVCVAAGASPREAAEAVGEALGGPVGAGLAQTAAELRLGGEPDRAWEAFGRLPGAVELARCLARADATGAPAARPVARLAGRLRADRARAAAVRAARAQVLITAPVGLCFLPAFLAIGVAPVVIGLADGLLSAP
ncbi:type II secretion system F family protein [Streptomyces sp. NPDC057638]|uniref:type II secretion system F family protein n=1 Tax=Streptomyces sp. NPDC057638 TaxID=3346190 RepID=UPI00367C063B